MKPLTKNFCGSPWVTESWFLAVLSRLSVLIWFVFAAVGAKSKLHQVPLSWSHSRHHCSWFLQNKASQTETIKKNTTGKRWILLFLIVTVSLNAIWDEDLPNVRRRQKMCRRLRQQRSVTSAKWLQHLSSPYLLLNTWAQNQKQTNFLSMPTKQNHASQSHVRWPWSAKHNDAVTNNGDG